MGNYDVIFEAARRQLAPAHEYLERLRQRISILQREERHLARSLAAREKMIEQAQQALQAADEEDERVRSQAEAELRALDSARVEAVPDGQVGDAAAADAAADLEPLAEQAEVA
ncbi:MAG TPA: hypothetical protein VFD01_15190 [Candidatus Dormibacteraeota bacterium]|jgi:chromosome segregation ATPase|nr:hypothetical protein [Candidatus Dormibacteraeota bacterium]